MQGKLNFREFLERVEKQLKTYSPDILLEIIMDWAKKTPPAKRIEFLAMLTPPPSNKKPLAPDKDLLEEIKALAERVENGDYCDGWGWDDELREERDWGDEGWADEVDNFFSQAYDALLIGQYNLAGQYYEQLFIILEMGQEPGHLPGHPDLTEMLATDLEETLLCYLHAVYMATPIDKRPARLLEVIQEHWYLAGSRFSLQKLIDASTTTLPDFNQFLSGLIHFLRKTGSNHDLIREAVKLSGGIPALAELARQEGHEHPKAYVDWLKALEEKEDYHTMIEIAQEGLVKVPPDYVVRAAIAEGLIKAGEILNDINLQLSGYREAFYSNPNLNFFLGLLSLAGEKNCFSQEAEAAIARIASLLNKPRSCEYCYPVDEEKMTSKSSQRLLVSIYLLTGYYEQAYHICLNKGSLGWTCGNNPKGLVIPFFLILLSGEMNSAATPNLERLWDEAVTIACDNGSIDLQERFHQVMDGVFKHLQLPEKDELKYLKWCITEAGSRVDAIVGGKHRGSYHKAATVIVAVAEVLVKRGSKLEGSALIRQYYQKYPRHRAFKEELNIAVAKSGVYSN